MAEPNVLMQLVLDKRIDKAEFEAIECMIATAYARGIDDGRTAEWSEDPVARRIAMGYGKLLAQDVLRRHKSEG